jgi:hypothetical protein
MIARPSLLAIEQLFWVNLIWYGLIAVTELGANGATLGPRLKLRLDRITTA